MSAAGKPETTFEDDGCSCSFRYHDNGHMDVLRVCTYHEEEKAAAFNRGQEEMREAIIAAFPTAFDETKNAIRAIPLRDL